MQLLIKPTTKESSAFYTDHKYNRPDDAGFDLIVPRDTRVYFKSTTKIDLEVIIVLTGTDKDLHYVITPRSSISGTALRLSNSIGVIDKKYRGSLLVALDYHDLCVERPLDLEVELWSGRQYSIVPAGTRLVQLLAVQIADISGYEIVDSHDTTERSDNGFGSTGV